MAIRPRWTSVYMGCWVLSAALMLIGCDPGSSNPPLGPGDEQIPVKAGHVVVVPAKTPHRFENSGDGSLRVLSVHPSDHVQQTDLE